MKIYRPSEVQAYAALRELHLHIGQIVVLSGQFEYMFMEIVAYIESPGDLACQRQCVADLYGKRGRYIWCRCLAAVRDAPDLSEPLRENLISSCSWYESNYETRNRLVHDAWVFNLTGEEAVLARYVTEKGRSHVVTSADVGAVRAHADEMVEQQLLLLGNMAELRRLTESDVHKDA
ncbi:MAG: hypothetical protein QOH50_3525 [Kribbellaceae bacterium]|jgi:hypothetical protein|nr:hypothetical protein [Kribbellaceae bacterium]